MAHLNYTFFDEFKRLDRLCGEIYDTQQGVTAYIEDMKTVTAEKYRRVPGFTADLDRLKRVRHIRNTLAHDEGAFDAQLCTQSDIDFIRSFYLRIMEGTDPMATLAQVSQRKKQESAPPYGSSRTSPRVMPPTLRASHRGNTKPSRSGCGLFAAALAILLLVFFVLSYQTLHG